MRAKEVYKGEKERRKKRKGISKEERKRGESASENKNSDFNMRKGDFSNESGGKKKAHTNTHYLKKKFKKNKLGRSKKKGAENKKDEWIFFKNKHLTWIVYYF